MLCFSVLISLLLILSVISSSTAIPEDKYGRKSGSIKLSVEPTPTEKVTTIIWKHKRDKAAEWFEEDRDPNATYYGTFISRTDLDMNTWSLTIRDLQPILQGEYSAEVNNRDATHFWNLIIIEAVREPTIKDVCNSMNCTLTCEGMGDSPLEHTWYDASGQQISTKSEITVQRNNQDLDFTCKLSNPVSHANSSVKVPRLVDSSHIGAAGLAFVIILALLLAILIVLILFTLCRWKVTSGKEWSQVTCQELGNIWKCTHDAEKGKETPEGEHEPMISRPGTGEVKGKKDLNGADVQLTGFKTTEDNDQGGAKVPLNTTDPPARTNGELPTGQTGGEAELSEKNTPDPAVDVSTEKPKESEEPVSKTPGGPDPAVDVSTEKPKESEEPVNKTPGGPDPAVDMSTEKPKEPEEPVSKTPGGPDPAVDMSTEKPKEPEEPVNKTLGGPADPSECPASKAS